MSKIKKSFLLIVISLISLQPTKAFALKESDWDMFDINGIYYFDKDAANCITSNLSGTISKLYDGSEIISQADLAKISANRPFYEKAAAPYGFPWQLLATIHYRETSLRRYNPPNGQGVYQLYHSSLIQRVLDLNLLPYFESLQTSYSHKLLGIELFYY